MDRRETVKEPFPFHAMMELLRLLKRLAVRIVSGFIRWTLKVLPLRQDAILFESVPDLDGSPRRIYDELRRRGLDKQYRLVWAVDAGFKAPGGFECLPCYGKLGPRGRIRREIVLAKAKAIVDSNRCIQKLKKNTYRMYARHGFALKNCDWYFDDVGEMDCCLSLSENMLGAERRLFRGRIPRFLHLGCPANDPLFDKVDLYALGFWRKLTGRPDRFSKIIGWMPTYRQHRMDSSHDAGSAIFPLGVPLLRAQEDVRRLNGLLQRENILLAVQMHHAQAANFPWKRFSNIVLVDPVVKRELDISNTCMMQGFDALITDYSGAYYEYILLDRPTAISVDDYEAYAANPGFALDFFDWIKGEYLKTAADLERFVENVARGRDVAREERRAAMRRIHNFLDNQSTKRVTDLLCEEAGLAVAGKDGTR